MSDVGYCFFKTSNSNDLIELKRARLLVAMLNILILEVKTSTAKKDWTISFLEEAVSPWMELTFITLDVFQEH